jgi:hypothetical protein
LNNFEGELAMKPDEESGEADEPPEEPPCSQYSTKKSERVENEELKWARRHVPEGYSGPGLVFRKTELHDRPPGSRAYQAATAPATGCDDSDAKERAGRIAALHDRLEAAEDRIDRAIDRLDRRLLALERQGES